MTIDLTERGPVTATEAPALPDAQAPQPVAPLPEAEPTIPRLLADLAVTVGVTGFQIAAQLTRTTARALHGSRLGQFAAELATGAVDAVTDTLDIHLSDAGRQAEDQLSRVVAVVMPVVIDSIDVEEVIRRIDLNTLLSEVDVNALLQQVDIEQLLDSVDIQAIIDSLDIESLAQRVKVGSMVVEGTSQVAESALDMARRQGVGLDVLLSGVINRILGRDSSAMPVGPELLAPGDGEAP